MTEDSVQKIAICGGGLASYMCVAALTNALPNNIELVLIETMSSSEADMFYGSTTSPSTYNFLLNLGITEPDLLPATNTSFSLGTRYLKWGPDKRSWTQSFHHPLPLFGGVGFHHYLTRLRETAPEFTNYEDYIISVQAANEGAFAHPPNERKTPLADMDFGYHFSPSQWRQFFSNRIETKRVARIKGDIETVHGEDGTVSSISLNDGRVIEADFFIDASGAKSAFFPHDNSSWTGSRRIKAISSHEQKTAPKGVTRILSSGDYGWQSHTPLQDGMHHLTIYAPASEQSALSIHGQLESSIAELRLGQLNAPWVGNCLTLGHGAAALEPYTPAPIMLLQRDIERLVELVPVSKIMAVESREYNRRFNDDYSHTGMFQAAFFQALTQYETPYWDAAIAEPISREVNSKIQQFENRGIHVQYDYEPFETQDWTMLHIGLGRLPKRYDPLADRVPEQQLKARLVQMRKAIEIFSKKLPLHEVYMARLLQYLKDQNG